MRSLATITATWEAHNRKICMLEVEHSIYDVDIETDEPQILHNARTRTFCWEMGKWATQVPLELTEGDLVEVELAYAGYWKLLTNQTAIQHMRRLKEPALPEVGDVLIERRAAAHRFYVVYTENGTVGYSRLPVEVDRCDVILPEAQISEHFHIYRGKSILDLKQ